MNIITIKLRNTSSFTKLISNLYELTKNEKLQIGLIDSLLSDGVLVQKYLTIDINDYSQFMLAVLEHKTASGFSMSVETRYENQTESYMH